MKRTILIVEDDYRTANWISIYLKREGFRTELAGDGPTGLELTRRLKPDLLILDLMLPGLSGTDLCRIIRRESDIPIIMTTARGSREDRIGGFEKGADDYVVKPFDPEELIGRVKAVLRRYKGDPLPIQCCGILELDQTAGRAFVDGEELELSHAQLSLLAAFMNHPDMVLSRGQLIDLAFDNDFNGFDRAIDTHIKRLRKVIHREGFEPLQTVYGAGYKMVFPK